MVHMKALSGLFSLQLSVSKDMDTSLRYENTTTFTARTLQCCGPRWPCLNSDYRNRILKYFWTHFKF
jgi:hypothetical protein